MRKDQGGQGGMVVNTASIVGKLHLGLKNYFINLFISNTIYKCTVYRCIASTMLCTTQSCIIKGKTNSTIFFEQFKYQIPQS